MDWTKNELKKNPANVQRKTWKKTSEKLQALLTFREEPRCRRREEW